MADGFEIDLDGEQVLFDGTWFSKEDLARKIKALVDAGDFRVSRPSAALEALQAAVAATRTVTLRLPFELAETLSAAAARQGLPVGAYLRELLARAAPPPAVPQPVLRLSSPVRSTTAVNETATADEAAVAVPLTPKRREEAPASEPENSWFNRR